MHVSSAPVRGWIQTASGRRFYPLAPDPGAINIHDIAHHLAHVGRFTGATHRFYSVAQHSVLVSYRAEAIARSWHHWVKDHATEVAKWGLLHDASEAYLVDVARPVKHQDAMLGYRKAEKVLQEVIITKFGLPLVEPTEVKKADAPDVLSTEARDLMAPLDPGWVAGMAGGYRPLPFRIRAWSPRRARAAFMRRYVELFEGASRWKQLRTWLSTYLHY